MATKPEFASEDKQIARSKLRQTFLKKLMELQGNQCMITTHEKTAAKAVFQGFNVDIQELLFDNLETPTGIMPHAILRSNDVIMVDFIENND